jgi:uncharacterized protein
MTLSTTAIDQHFETAAQISLSDISSIEQQGFKSIINCRPDFEAGPDQATSEAIAALATEHGLHYAHFPVITGTSGEEFSTHMAAFLASAPQPIFAFCRSGTRAGKLYALAQAIMPAPQNFPASETLQSATISAHYEEKTYPETPSGFQLSSFEARVLGVLLEKRFLTPDTYPLSLNSLTLGCNQLTAREPIMSLSETAVKDTLDLLQERKLTAPRQQAGARVVKYEHRLYQHANLDDEMLAVLCVLLLRGAQTLGELKQRTDRMVGFSDLSTVQAAIERLSDLRMPYVQALPKAPGTKEVRYVECLSDDAGRLYANSAAISSDSDAAQASVGKGRLGELEDEVIRLKRDLESLTHAFLDFKKTFD